jgi:hypothetical protein
VFQAEPTWLCRHASTAQAPLIGKHTFWSFANDKNSDQREIEASLLILATLLSGRWIFRSILKSKQSSALLLPEVVVGRQLIVLFGKKKNATSIHGTVCTWVDSFGSLTYNSKSTRPEFNKK